MRIQFPKILRNRARCLGCGEVVESRYRHEFVTCGCGNLSVDGGLEYLKRSVGKLGWENLEELGESVNQDIEVNI